MLTILKDRDPFNRKYKNDNVFSSWPFFDQSSTDPDETLSSFNFLIRNKTYFLFKRKQIAATHIVLL